MHARTERRSCISCEICFAGAPSCVRAPLSQGMFRFRELIRAMLVLLPCLCGSHDCVTPALLPVLAFIHVAAMLFSLPLRPVPRSRRFVPTRGGDPEIPPSFRLATLRQTPLPPAPQHQERTSGTTPFSAARLLFPGRACSRFFPDAAEPDPAFRYGSSSSQTKRRLVRESRPARSTSPTARPHS